MTVIPPDFGFGFNVSTDTFKSVLVFTAPVSGTYSLEAIFVKLYGLNGGVKSVSNVSVYKNGTGDALVVSFAVAVVAGVAIVVSKKRR